MINESKEILDYDTVNGGFTAKEEEEEEKRFICTKISKSACLAWVVNVWKFL